MIKGDLKTCDNVRKIETGQVDDYTTECLLDYTYFKIYFELIAIDFSKQQKLDADAKAIQQINFTGDLTRKEVARMYFIIEEASQAVQYERLKYYDYILFWYNVSRK